MVPFGGGRTEIFGVRSTAGNLLAEMVGCPATPSPIYFSIVLTLERENDQQMTLAEHLVVIYIKSQHGMVSAKK